MSPFELDILLHYYSRRDDHPVLADNPPIWTSTRGKMKSDGLLGENDPVKVGEPLYYLTERGKVYIEAILSLPLPVQQWVMPNAGSDR